MVVADVVDVGADQARVQDEPLVVSAAERAASQDVVELLRLESLSLFLVFDATERIRGMFEEERVGDVRPEVIDAYAVATHHIGDGMSVVLYPMLVELVDGHGHAVPPFSSPFLAVSFVVEAGIGLMRLSL